MDNRRQMWAEEEGEETKNHSTPRHGFIGNSSPHLTLGQVYDFLVETHVVIKALWPEYVQHTRKPGED